MRRGLKRIVSGVLRQTTFSPRARPLMRRGLKLVHKDSAQGSVEGAARAAPYEKGTETIVSVRCVTPSSTAARAAPYEKGTETN